MIVALVGGSRGAFQAHAPPFRVLGQMWVCPNRKMKIMHGECAPLFWIRGGVVLRKRNEIEKYVSYLLGFGLECSENGKNDMKSKKKRSTIFDHLPSGGFGDYINVWL